MKFLSFLKESHNKHKNTSHIILQKIIDMIDNGHVDYTKQKISVNIGKLIKDSSFYDLYIVVRKADDMSVKLGKNSLDDKLYIVIDTNYFPERQNLAKLFSRAEVVSGFEKQFSKYLSKYHEDNGAESKTGHEIGKEVNTNRSFEKNFKQLEQVVNDTVKEYNAAKAHIEKELSTTNLPSRKASLQAGLEHLKSESLGKNAKEFVSKMMKLADPKFVEHIDADNKKKVIARLTSYYEHHFA
jgi:hypothetical protein